ncbi:hypothetical protein [Mammaliicoccus sciuri]|uniref:hypothetical protein n=1 Tax=Mammaliicoccus sciuri TaxID=1296 RepID=UPI000D1E5183|nr:hypothetical protein [Mammaliicoccus sciuri]PTK22728.1 hypothetical protein BUZ86_14085 [Mammaliicoccus sciuri]
MENLLNIATIIAGIAGVFTIIFPFVKNHVENKRYKEYLNLKSKKFQNKIVKQASKSNKDYFIYRVSSKEIIKEANNYIIFLNYEIENKENVGKRKKLHKKINNQVSLLSELIERNKDIIKNGENNLMQDSNVIEERYLNMSKDINNYFIEF